MPLLGEGFLASGSAERDREQWKYILGNPPYIRAERVKYNDEMKGLWQSLQKRIKVLTTNSIFSKRRTDSCA